METNKEVFFKKYDKILIYFVIYTIIFFAFIKTLPYTIPFVLALVVSAMVTPLIKKIRAWSNNKINHNIAIISVLLVFYGILGTIVTSSLIRIAKQAILLVSNSTSYINKNYDSIVDWFQKQYDWIVSNIKSLDPEIVQSGNDLLRNTLSSVQNILVSFGKALGSFTIGTITALPTFMLVVIFTMVCSYFFTKSFVLKPNLIYNYFPTSSKHENRVKDIFTEGKNMILRYSLSYSLIITITGVISLTGYLILGIPYALVLAIITAFLDLLPILGVSATYLPLAIYYYAQGSVRTPIGLIIMYIIVAVGRNIWEPKILSSSLNISPIFTIMALFIGLKLAGFIGVFYLITLVVGFKILQTVGVLPEFNDGVEKKKPDKG